MKKRICTRCVIDDTVPGADIANDGVCGYCRIHDALDRAYPQGEAGQKRLDRIFADIRASGRGKAYDCVIGFSGGTDSTYLVHYAKSQGLRPLAVHFDNGWNSSIAVSNIKNAVSRLDVALQTYVVDWEEFRDILRAHLRASIPWADVPTDLGLSAALYRVAAEEGIKYILVGNNFRTEGKQPTEWTYGDGRMVRAIMRRFGGRPLKTYPNLTLPKVIVNAFLRRIKLVRPLYYLDYDKDSAKTFLEKEIGWEDYGGHHYESIFTRYVYTAYLVEKYGIDKRVISLSAQVRSGSLDRSEALDILSRPSLTPKQLQADKNYVMKKLELSQEEFDDIMALAPKSFKDYPSYYRFIQRYSKLARTLVKYLLPWTPMIFFEMDERNKMKTNSMDKTRTQSL